MTKLDPPSYTVDIAGLAVELPLVPVTSDLAISLLIDVDRGVRFLDHVGRKLAEKFADAKPDIVIGTATLGIPVAIEVSRYLGLDRYVILHKSPKVHLQDALVEHVESIASVGKQRLLLDRDAIPLLSGKRVLVVDDVVATGSSLSASIRLARKAGANIVGIGVILTEAHEWRPVLGADADLVRGLGHIPQFRIHGSNATIIPSSVEAARPGAA
ncbi:MAG: phosphoribosyltransferase family protein [Pseudorhodoplanes sp.]